MSTSSPFLALRRPRIILLLCVTIVFLVLLFPPARLSQFSEGLRFPGSSNLQHKERPKGVIVMLLPPARLHQAMLTLRNVEERFNRRLKYPYVLFMVEGELEQVTEVQRARIEHITEGRAKFATVLRSQWDLPESLDKSLVEASLQTIGFSHGYRAMCRFYSGELVLPSTVMVLLRGYVERCATPCYFWKHPALVAYDWLWRLDTDIEFHCDVNYDPIERLVENNALYGFVQVSDDADWVQPTLASNVSAFMASIHNPSQSDLLDHHDKTPPAFPEDANLAFVWRGEEGVAKALRGEAGNSDWTHRCMYNNFEISHRSVWESEIYARFFEYLDRTGGFFYERWGDAPIHSFGIAMTLRKDQAFQLKDTGYQHQGWEYHCPAQSPSCTCVQEKNFENFKDRVEGWFDPEGPV
ncbi:putative glycosyltransferase family 15 protein [Lyophyllum shimeji]|uniref:Glycosyltransferase family 15 protein n=1 Tax=Lyophyllum shimeji TaxID=47721 RepID=A0A9P3PX90_LYOSH|nr:putative glycosyltransferase family 15 protein [Lyophyllum shimeji]